MHGFVLSLALIAAFATIAYLAALVYLFFYQERILFPGGTTQATPSDWGGDAEDITLQVGSFSIHSLLFKPVTPVPGVILYFHGNRGDLAFQWAAIARDLMLKTGWMVWVMDYPGYGLSTGHFVREKQLYKLGPIFVDEIQRRFGVQIPIISYGRSIGSGFATRLAAKTTVAGSISGLVLETPYLNMRRLAGEKFRWVPIWLLRYRIRTNKYIKRVSCPIFIVHGTNDETVPYAHGEALAKIVPQAHFLTIPGGKHNNLSQSKAYWADLQSWLGSIADKASQRFEI